ncbi:hypothetical protein SLEP1_g58977 [Rubroshorea leprosula]|uniref:Uncharacterized protein n=1 Tax=Rubroshorea leprosula TaxID=152421 RepID=A0AAV5MUK5_9ROSI|nr:hypothetical protein SLEP1_g58977 [Rubroshorea leprosula]
MDDCSLCKSESDQRETGAGGDLGGRKWKKNPAAIGS